MTTNNLLLALHNTHSSSIVKLFAETIMGFPSVCKNVIFSKVTASAASIGIPDAQKTVLSKAHQGSLYFFSDLSDTIEIFKPDIIYLLVSQQFGKNPIPFERINNELKDQKILVIVGGSSPGLTRKELDMGECIYVDRTTSRLNPITLTSVFLFGLLQYRSENQ